MTSENTQQKDREELRGLEKEQLITIALELRDELDLYESVVTAARDINRLSGVADQLYDGPSHDFCETFPCRHQEFSSALDTLTSVLTDLHKATL